MRYVIVLAALLLASGCISLGERTAPADNLSGMESPEENDTGVPEPPPPVENRYQANGFSFTYPAGMDIEESKGSSSGIFSGSKQLVSGQTGEIFIVTYLDTEAVYGANQDDIFKDDPTKAASDFLQEDMEEDQAGGLLSSAYDVDEQSTFAIARDGAVAEATFKIRFGDSNKSYSGYAMDIYVPERSLHVKMRALALDPQQAESIRDGFLLSFRLE